MELKIEIPDNPYLLLTPGPLSTSPGVRTALLRDWCTWDEDYNSMVQEIRAKLVKIATKAEGYTATLMQGSGTFSVESVIGSAIPADGCVLVLVNGAYGRRIVEIANRLQIRNHVVDFGEFNVPDSTAVHQALSQNPSITHVAMVHCETTTGVLNPVSPIGELAKSFKKMFILDAMSSFGGMPLDMDELNIDFLISSANKCIQGVPGFGFVIAKEEAMMSCKDNARSLSLDLYEQWDIMERQHGKWRYTSPTHTVRAFAQALEELEEEGLVSRFKRYLENQRTLVRGMRELGFQSLLEDEFQSPFITAFLNPQEPGFSFTEFYKRLKNEGFVIYPGKVTNTETFRIGNIGYVFREDIERLLTAVANSKFW